MRTLYFFRILVTAVILVFSANISAQTYSVQTSLVPSGPHYNYLSHLADQNNHLQVMLTLLDFNTPPINVRLRVRVEGPGYVLYTNPNVTVGQPLTLESGVPLFLTDLDLQPYFHQSNLIVSPSGVDINNLPEGYTSVCVDVVLDGTNQEVISSNNCTAFQLTRFQPSLPSFPICESVIDTNEMFLTCQWTDPIGYVPDGNSYMEHTFTLHRWTTPNNYSVFQSGQGFVTEVVTSVPMVNIPLMDLQLDIGEQYIWRIQSRIYSNSGLELQMIENSGVSLPCTFHFGEPQTLADVLTDGLFIDLNAASTSDIKGKAWWTVVDNTPNQGLDEYDKYLVEYRRQPTGNETYQIPWITDTVIDSLDFIYQLEPSTTYEVKVSGIVGNSISDPTPVKTFTTQDPRQYACGDTDMPFMPFGWTPLENAQAGIQVQIGQFMLHTTQLQAVGGTGHYSGKGTIPIPFLMGAKAKVTFDDILIDTEFMVRDGRVDVITQGLENWLHQQYSQFVDPIYVSGVIDSAWVDSMGVAWAMVDGVAIPYTFDPPDYPIVLNDENGNQYTIYPNDSIEVSTYVAISEEWDVDPDEVAVFSQNANENRGFDPKEHMQWHENYEIMRLADSSLYFVANKSMAEGESDVVNIELPQGTTASFQLADGTPITSIPATGWMGTPTYQNGVQYTLNLPVMPSSGNYSLHVFANNQKVGEMNIVVYSEKQKNVIIVPLVSNLGVTESEIKTSLDKTLGEANINVSVEVTPQWNDTIFTPTKSIGLPTEVGILTKYSQEQRDLRDAYFAANPSAESDAYYLFVVHSFDDPEEVGYMVRGRGMGFIKATQQDILNTIAHELGHGIGALEHTWKHNGPDRDSTSNLMDYGTVEGNLIRAQWRELRDFDLLPSLFDDVDDYMNQLAQFSPEAPSETAPTIQYDYIEESLVSVDDALMVNGGWFVKFKTPSRSKFTHFCLVNGKVIGLFQGNQFLALSTTAFRSKPAENQEYDVEITGQSHVISFLTTDTIIAATREYITALHGSDTTKLIEKYASSDIRGITYIDVVHCNEIGGAYINGKVNGILTRDTVQCPEGGDCNQQDILTIIENDKKAIKDEFLSIIQSANGGFNWNPVRFIEGQNDIITTEDVTVITEKVQTLNHYRNNTIVGVVSLKGLLNNLYTTDILNQMTSDIVNELSQDYQDKKLVLFLAHYIKQEENGIFTTTPYTCQRVSFATSDNSLVDPSFSTLDLMNAPNATNAFFSLFTNIKKPYHIVNIYEKYDGSLAVYESDNLTDPTKDKFGLPFVKGAFHLVSKSKQYYNQAIFDLTFSVGNFLPATGLTNHPVIDNYIIQKRLEYGVLKDNFDANIELWESERLDMPEYWVAGDVDFTNIREHHITKDVIRLEYLIEKKELQRIADLIMAMGWSVGSSNSSIYYEFDIMTNVIDPIVYDVVDALGLVPGIDILADGAGVIYSTIRGNNENVVIYSSALAIPFVGAAVVKTGKKVYAIFAKKTNEQLVDITVKQMDEATEGWTRISNKVETDVTKDQATKQALEEVAEEFDENAAKKLIILEEGVSNLTGKTAIISKLDALGNLSHAKSFVNNLDELADASIITKLDDLTNTQLQGLDNFYKNIKSPLGYNGQLNFTVTKTIGGESITVTYKNGLPDLTSYSPILSFTDGSAPAKFKFQSSTLNGKKADFTQANTELAKKFNIEKIGGNWPWQNGYMTNGNFRIAQTNSGSMSQQFELFENGEWVKYTWHHFEDGKTVFPVKTSIHSIPSGFNHSGGKSIMANGLKGLFTFTSF